MLPLPWLRSLGLGCVYVEWSRQQLHRTGSGERPLRPMRLSRDPAVRKQRRVRSRLQLQNAGAILRGGCRIAGRLRERRRHRDVQSAHERLVPQQRSLRSHDWLRNSLRARVLHAGGHRGSRPGLRSSMGSLLHRRYPLLPWVLQAVLLLELGLPRWDHLHSASPGRCRNARRVPLITFPFFELDPSDRSAGSRGNRARSSGPGRCRPTS